MGDDDEVNHSEMMKLAAENDHEDESRTIPSPLGGEARSPTTSTTTGGGMLTIMNGGGMMRRDHRKYSINPNHQLFMTNEIQQMQKKLSKVGGGPGGGSGGVGTGAAFFSLQNAGAVLTAITSSRRHHKLLVILACELVFVIVDCVLCIAFSTFNEKDNMGLISYGGAMIYVETRKKRDYQAFLTLADSNTWIGGYELDIKTLLTIAIIKTWIGLCIGISIFIYIIKLRRLYSDNNTHQINNLESSRTQQRHSSTFSQYSDTFTQQQHGHSPNLSVRGPSEKERGPSVTFEDDQDVSHQEQQQPPYVPLLPLLSVTSSPAPPSPLDQRPELTFYLVDDEMEDNVSMNEETSSLIAVADYGSCRRGDLDGADLKNRRTNQQSSHRGYDDRTMTNDASSSPTSETAAGDCSQSSSSRSAIVQQQSVPSVRRRVDTRSSVGRLGRNGRTVSVTSSRSYSSSSPNNNINQLLCHHYQASSFRSPPTSAAHQRRGDTITHPFKMSSKPSSLTNLTLSPATLRPLSTHHRTKAFGSNKATRRDNFRTFGRSFDSGGSLDREEHADSSGGNNNGSGRSDGGSGRSNAMQSAVVKMEDKGVGTTSDDDLLHHIPTITTTPSHQGEYEDLTSTNQALLSSSVRRNPLLSQNSSYDQS